MKTNNPVRKSVCLLFCISFFATASFSQDCGNGKTASKISYDTSFVGGGNNHYDANLPQFDTTRQYFSLPQFEPFKGTLIRVDIETVINVTNTYKIENSDVNASNPKVKINRADTITSSAFLTPFESSQSKTIASLNLKASDGVNGSGLDYKADGPIKTYNNFAINYQINSNLAGFMGNGYVTFLYDTGTDLFASGSNAVFTSTTIDSVYFKLTYYYCLTSILPADISNFTATKLGSGNLQLTWKSYNDNIGDKYEVQKSTDGKNYTSFQTMTSKAGAVNSFLTGYTPTNDDKNKVFFRIKQFEADGTVKYSIVKAVDLDYVASTMKVYPTVTKRDINIYFPYAAKADYQVNIISITGQVMQQSSFARTTFIKVALNAGLKPGLYVVNVINKQTAESQQSKIVIQ